LVLKVQLVNKVLKELKVKLVLKELKVKTEQTVLREQTVCKVHKVKMAEHTQFGLEHKRNMMKLLLKTPTKYTTYKVTAVEVAVHKVLRVLMEQMVHKVLKVQMVLQVVLKEQMVHKVHKEMMVVKESGQEHTQNILHCLHTIL
jgi:hypothetical protein